jgi:hypothetical protein
MALVVPAVLFGLLLAVPVQAANYPLEITQPQANLNVTNRFYKAYPDLPYEVRLAVVGGLYPYQFSLGTAPAGMSIDAHRGTITWPHPVELGSPHQVQATVVDGEGNQQTVSWTITVTTQGFRFLDAVNGLTVAQGGTGSIENPWKTIADWYEGTDYASKTAASYVDEFLYWRSGVYSLADAYKEDAVAGMHPGRVPVLASAKPVVWLAYPGELPVIDHAYNGAPDSGAFIIFYASSENVYIDGLEFRNTKCKSIEMGADGSNQVLRNLQMHDLHYGEDGANCAFVMTTTGEPGDNMVIQDSSFHDLNIVSAAAMLKIYAKNKLLIEDNTLHTVTGSDDSEGIALKGGEMTRLTVRGNVIHGVPRKSIGGNMHTLQDSEILFNCIYNAADAAIDINQDGLATNLYVYRNTVLGRVQVRNTDSADGPFFLYNNVFVNDDSGTPEGSHVFHDAVSDPSQVVLTDNLVGFPEDGITDAAGNLSPAHQQYLGTHGCQLTEERGGEGGGGRGGAGAFGGSSATGSGDDGDGGDGAFGGPFGNAGSADGNDAGCGCLTAGRPSQSHASIIALLGLALGAMRRRQGARGR